MPQMLPYSWLIVFLISFLTFISINSSWSFFSFSLTGSSLPTKSFLLDSKLKGSQKEENEGEELW